MCRCDQERPEVGLTCVYQRRPTASAAVWDVSCVYNAMHVKIVKRAQTQGPAHRAYTREKVSQV